MRLHFDLPQLKTELMDMYSLEVMSPGTAQDPLAPLSHPVMFGMFLFAEVTDVEVYHWHPCHC